MIESALLLARTMNLKKERQVSQHEFAFCCIAHDDNNPSLFINDLTNEWNCQACAHGGKTALGLWCFLNAIPYDETRLEENLRKYSAYCRGGDLNEVRIGKKTRSSKEFYQPREKPVHLSYYPSHLKELSFKDAVLLATVHYYVRNNFLRWGRDAWKCSLKQFREKFLHWPEATLLRSIRRLEQKDLLSVFSDRHSTIWRINESAFRAISENSGQTVSVGADFQNDSTANSIHKNSANILKFQKLFAGNLKPHSHDGLPVNLKSYNSSVFFKRGQA